MLDVLQFVFSSFWVFIGTLMILGVIVKGIVALAAVLFGRGNLTIT